MLYAPFVKQMDKLDKDVADMSLSDFIPKRFALNYEPPVIGKYIFTIITHICIAPSLLTTKFKISHSNYTS